MKAIDQLCVYLFTRRLFNPIQDGPFWGSSRLGGGGGKMTPPLNLLHV